MTIMAKEKFPIVSTQPEGLSEANKVDALQAFGQDWSKQEPRKVYYKPLGFGSNFKYVACLLLLALLCFLSASGGHVHRFAHGPGSASSGRISIPGELSANASSNIASYETWIVGTYGATGCNSSIVTSQAGTASSACLTSLKYPLIGSVVLFNIDVPHIPQWALCSYTDSLCEKQDPKGKITEDGCTSWDELSAVAVKVVPANTDCP